jgi:hypothetical protein
MMPKVDGIEVCRRLKADPSFPFMPIILVPRRFLGTVEGMAEAGPVGELRLKGFQRPITTTTSCASEDNKNIDRGDPRERIRTLLVLTQIRAVGYRRSTPTLLEAGGESAMSTSGGPPALETEFLHPSAVRDNPLGNGEPQRVVLFSDLSAALHCDLARWAAQD